MAKPIRVLYMEDDAGAARLFQKRLQRKGYTVDLAKDGEEGIAMYNAAPYDVVAVDQKMPVYDGLEVIRILAAQGELPPIVMITGVGDERIAVEAMKLGARDYIVKDVAGGYLELLPSVLEQVMHQQRLLEEKRQAEEALRQHAKELQIRNEDLEAFSRSVAHDLKMPLSAVVGFASFLREHHAGMSEEEFLENIDIIVQSGNSMSKIINALLLLARVRKEEIEREPLDMGSIVAEAQRRLSMMIKEHQARIIASPTWPIASGYGPWIEEVWVNYLSNAIKHGGSPPHVEIGATPLDDGMVRFWIRDNGGGISPQQQAHLFHPFTQLNKNNCGGHGLGLSIVRRIVEKLGGQVGVQSEGVPGKGSLFTFTLPAVSESQDTVQERA